MENMCEKDTFFDVNYTKNERGKAVPRQPHSKRFATFARYLSPDAVTGRIRHTSLGEGLEMADAEDGAFGIVGEALDFPAMREDDLLDDGETKAGPLLVRGEVGFENFLSLFGQNAGAVITNFQTCLRGAVFARDELDLAALAHCLDAIEKQIEERLPE